MDDVSNPQRDQMMAEFDRRRRARTLTLPTDDSKVSSGFRSKTKYWEISGLYWGGGGDIDISLGDTGIWEKNRDFI